MCRFMKCKHSSDMFNVSYGAIYLLPAQMCTMMAHIPAVLICQAMQLRHMFQMCCAVHYHV